MVAPKVYGVGIYKPIQHSPLRNGSIGIALLHSSEGNEEEMLKKADTAMYEAKMAGHNSR